MHTIFLRYFDEVARQGSIRKAAQVLNVSSTTVNRKLLSVEEKLGVSLFDRTPEGVELTAVGGILLEHCRKTLYDYDRTKVLIDDVCGQRSGHINVHTVDSVALSILPRAIRQFSESLPDISISVTTAQPDEVIQAVAGGQADIGISFNFEIHPDVRALSEKSSPFGIIIRPDHPLAERTSVRISDLGGYRMVRTIDARGHNSIIDLAINSLASPLSTHIFTNMLILAKRMILDNQGIGLYTKIGFYDEIMRDELRFVPLVQETLTNVRIGVFVSAAHGIGPGKRLLCDAIQRALAPMRLDN